MAITPTSFSGLMGQVRAGRSPATRRPRNEETVRQSGIEKVVRGDRITQANPQTQSRLMSLPGEIRNMIWNEVLTVSPKDKPSQHGVATVKMEGLPPKNAVHIANMEKSRRYTYSVLSLLATCRAIHQETAGIFYFLNELRFEAEEDHLPTPAQIIKSLGVSRTDSIRTVALELPTDRHTWSALARLPNLEKVELVASKFEWRNFDLLQEGLLELSGLHAFEIKVAGEMQSQAVHQRRAEQLAGLARPIVLLPRERRVLNPDVSRCVGTLRSAILNYEEDRDEESWAEVEECLERLPAQLMWASDLEMADAEDPTPSVFSREVMQAILEGIAGSRAE